MKSMLAVLPLVAAAAVTPVQAQTSAPTGSFTGQAWVHTAESRAAAVANASIALPASVTGGAMYAGKLSAAPREARGKVPVVLFLHGSSGLGLAAIGEWQAWLAGQGIASMAPDSMGLAGRINYKSPIDKATYEKIHALRQSEVDIAMAALRELPWADTGRIVLAGTSEGAVPVARHPGQFSGRMIFSWSCEDNYFVTSHQTHTITEPVLNVISSVDPYFSAANSWLGQPTARGHCGEALKAHKAATIVLVPGAPHTLLNLPQPRQVVKAWLADLLGAGR